MEKKSKKIEQIVDKKGIVYNAEYAINVFRPITSEFHNSRMGNDEFRCNLCGMPVMFTSNGKTRYIKHKPIKEESKCPWHTRVTLTKEEADALKYNGAKEGEKHIRYKNFLFNMFKRSKDFSDEALETRRTITIDTMIKWRQPDVFAIYKDKIKVACEVQLQTILMTHIKGRRKFYKKDDTFMMWFFDDIDIKDYRFSDGDIFFTNNTNGFFLNDKIITLSRENNSLVVGVKYYDYYLDENNEINFKSISKIIPFGSITFDEETREVYYFDSRAKKKKLEDKIFINTPVEIGEIFEYNNIKFKLLMAKSGKLHIHYLNSNNLWRGGKYHGFHDDVLSAKREIVSILKKEVVKSVS